MSSESSDQQTFICAKDQTTANPRTAHPSVFPSRHPLSSYTTPAHRIIVQTQTQPQTHSSNTPQQTPMQEIASIYIQNPWLLCPFIPCLPAHWRAPFQGPREVPQVSLPQKGFVRESCDQADPAHRCAMNLHEPLR